MSKSLPLIHLSNAICCATVAAGPLDDDDALAVALRPMALAVLHDAVRRGEFSETPALALHERMTAVKRRLLADRVSRRTAWTVARERPSSSLRDAEYVAITELQADALVTTDPTLAAVADGLVVLAPSAN